MPLSMAPEKINLMVTGFRGGFGLRRRLADLGFNIGMDVLVMVNQSAGPMVVAIKDSRFAISRGLAHHIFVEPK